MADTLEQAARQELERLQQQRREVESRRSELDKEIRQIDHRLKVTQNYLEAMSAPDGTSIHGRTRKGGGNSGRSGIREQVLSIVSQAADGMSASAVLEALQATEKEAKTSARNALAALKKGGKLLQENGIYKAA